jgi:hypothetical protein
MAIGDIVQSIVVLTTALTTVIITVLTTVIMGIGPGCMAGILAGCMAGIVRTIHIGMATTLDRDSGMASISKDREAERGAKRGRAEAPAIGASALESFKPFPLSIFLS